MQILDLSAQGAVAILAVLFVRLLLRKTPKIFSYLLWSIVLFRLICPVSISAPFSMMPVFTPVEQDYTLQDTSVDMFSAGVAAYEAVGDALNGGLGVQHVYTQQVEDSGMPVIVTAQWWEVWVLFGQYAWLAGMFVLTAYSVAVYLKLRYKLFAAPHLEKNIYLSDKIPSAFVLGIFNPKIYLPTFVGDSERSYILAHEQHHIRRMDHIFKLVAYCVLMLHWFNPLVWLAYILFCKDMEMSCDEAVIKKLGPEIRADYAASLLNLAIGQTSVTAMPLAFGEGDTKGRVKNMSKWKKPKRWICIIAAVLILLLAAVLLTDPLDADVPNDDLAHMTVPHFGGIKPDETFDIVQSWAGWVGDGPVWACLNAAKLQYSNVQHLPIHKFDMRKELDAFMERMGNTAALNDTTHGVPSFRETAARYDDSFFENNTLILVYISSANSGRAFQVSEIFCNQSHFEIYVEEIASPFIKEQKVSGWFITAAVPDSMVENCIDFDASLDNISRKAPEMTYSREEPDGSFYNIEAPLQATDLSVVSDEVKQLVRNEWAVYDAMPELDRYASSHLWGSVYLYADSWKSALDKLNLDISNPLESLSFLKKGNYMDGKELTEDKPRVQTTVLALSSTDRQISQLGVRTGYTAGDVRVTFWATVWNTTGVYLTGGGFSEHASYQKARTVTASGKEACLVMTEPTENYVSMNAYWVDGNVLYNIYLVAEPDQQEQLQKVMNQLLAEV